MATPEQKDTDHAADAHEEKRHNISQNPITGPYPDGDSRNITLAPSDNSIEPKRTGPQEHRFREERDTSTAKGRDADASAAARDDGADANGKTSSASAETAPGTPAKSYSLESDDPSPAETAFGRPGGALKKPVLQNDWNPAERNSDDLSR